jgi:hypothetical protein
MSNWIAKALATEVWNIGQLDAATVRSLDKLAKAGTLVRTREYFCGLRLKTVWRAA